MHRLKMIIFQLVVLAMVVGGGYFLYTDYYLPSRGKITWQAFVYPDMRASKRFVNVGTFTDPKHCRAAAVSAIPRIRKQRSIPNEVVVGYKCGLNCTFVFPWLGVTFCQQMIN